MRSQGIYQIHISEKVIRENVETTMLENMIFKDFPRFLKNF